MRNRRFVPIALAATAAAVAAALGATGCASGPPRATTANLARAHALVASAEQSEAQRYAATDLQRARDESQQADTAAQHGDAEQADRLASKAALDAQLASARAKNGAAQHALAAVNESLGTLRSEEGRQSPPPQFQPQSQPPQSPPPPPPPPQSQPPSPPSQSQPPTLPPPPPPSSDTGSGPAASPAPSAAPGPAPSPAH